MLVILRENVENLGKIGDLVKVSSGFARNYLLPRRLVMVADEGNVKQLENQKKILQKRQLAQKATSQELAQRLAGFSCTIKKKVGENDKLFGSVSASEILDELVKAGFPIERRMIHLAEPIRSLGVHEVNVRIQTEVSTVLKVWVVKE